MSISINEKLSHLDSESIKKLMSLYYSSAMKTKDLIEAFNIDITPSRLYTLFPPLECADKICPQCNINMFIGRPSKTDYPQNSNTAFCPKCNHIDSYTCKCPSCISHRESERQLVLEKKRLEDIEKRSLIGKVYNLSDLESVNIDDISFRDRVYIGALLRLALSEDLSSIVPIESVDNSLAPTPSMLRDIVKSLIYKNIIKVHPINSHIDAFTGDDDNPYPAMYYMYKVYYHLNLDFGKSKDEIINDLLYPKISKEDIPVDAYDIWKEIALQECLEYLKYQMNRVNFEFNPGEKTILVINDLLDNFSVSQIYNIIYTSITRATRYYQENKVSRRQAANSVITRCQTFGERALSEKWDLNKYSRAYELPQSCLSEFFFNRVLVIGDKGFHECPSVELILNQE